MKTMHADLVIIGGGGTGLPAALTAIEGGVKRVLLLEKRLTLGGNASMAGGFLFAAESHHQEQIGVEMSRDAVFKETMAFHHYDRVNPRILRAFIDKSGETIQWLEDRGAAFKFEQIESIGVHMLKDMRAPVGGFSRVIKMMGERFENAGGILLKKTGASKILRGTDGKICGVVATTSGGEDIQITTTSVILASGGFTGNTELLKSYFPYYYDDAYWTDAVPHMGDGIPLARDAGAGLDEYCSLVRETAYSFETKKSMPNRAAMEPCSLWVNCNGERFADESIYLDNTATNALLAQPGRTGFAIFDKELLTHMVEQPRPVAGPEVIDIREILDMEAKTEEWCKKADTLIEIAEWIGADPEALSRTMEQYNSFCDRGHDDLFAKDAPHLMPLRTAPFYALKFRPLMIETVGPIWVNERMEVLDTNKQVIPGFYAGGAITSGWQGRDYHIVGSALGYAINSGRIAGENAVEYVQSQESSETHQDLTYETVDDDSPSSAKREELHQ